MKRTNKIKSYLVLLPIVILMLMHNICFAYDGSYPTDKELLRLPPYCKARLQGVGSAESGRWIRVLGRTNWVGLHHYCHRLNLINRANMELDAGTQKEMLRGAYSGLKKYLAKDTTRDFVLRYEVHYNIGRVAIRIDQYGDALVQLEKSIQIKPTYTPAYAALSDFYKDNGDLEEARNVLQRGLKHKPKSKSLNRRLKALSKK